MAPQTRSQGCGDGSSKPSESVQSRLSHMRSPRTYLSQLWVRMGDKSPGGAVFYPQHQGTDTYLYSNISETFLAKDDPTRSSQSLRMRFGFGIRGLAIWRASICCFVANTTVAAISLLRQIKSCRTGTRRRR